VIDSSDHWALRAHPDPVPIAGWTIIDLKRHAESWSSLHDDESRELGVLLRNACAAIQAATGCARVYVLSFAEVVRHVHLHLVPRHDDEPESTGWSVADLYRAVAAGERAPADQAACEQIMARIRSALAHR